MVNKFITELKAGDQGVEDTVNLMYSYINQWKNNSKVIDLVNKMKKYNELETARNIFNFVVNNIQYRYDPQGIELVKSVKHTIFGDMKFGDCDDLTVALNTLLEAAGIKTQIKTIAWRKGQDAFSHVYTVAFINNQWKALDPTMKQAGFNKEANYHRSKIWKNNGN